MLHIPTVLELFPESQIIHIFRDGRDVALSQFKHPSAQSRNAYIAANVWKQRVDAGRAMGATLSADQYTEVRYEALLHDPESTLRDLCDYLNEPFETQMLQLDYLERQAVKRVIGKDHQLDVDKKVIVKSNQQKWKREMSARDRAIFESIAGGLLHELGYETEGKNHDPSAIERIKWKSHQKFMFLAARLNAANKRDWIPTHARMRWAITRQKLRAFGVLR